MAIAEYRGIFFIKHLVGFFLCLNLAKTLRGGPAGPEYSKTPVSIHSFSGRFLLLFHNHILQADL
jgi:hypothetical protein